MANIDRAKYMADLQLKSELEDRVLQAVKLQQRTGQVAALPDMRTLDEKLVDITKLKSKVRSDLLTITDHENASDILGQLNNHDLQFVAQSFNLLAAEIRPKFALGITAAQFMVFLRAYAAKEAENMVAGRPIGALDLARSVEGFATKTQVDRLMTAVQNSAVPQDLQDAIMESLGLMREASPDSSVDANGYDFDMDDVQEAGALPNGFEMDILAEELDAGDAGALQQIAAIPSKVTKSRVEALGRATGSRVPRTPEAMTRRDHKAAMDDAREESIRLGLPIHSRGDKETPYSLTKLKSQLDAYYSKPAPGKKSITGSGVTQLGRYTIHPRKLQDDIVQIRTKKGNIIPKFPSEKVSPNVASALRKIVGGSVLSFDEIAGLSDSERRYLNRVTTQCDIPDGGIPAPKKDDIAKEHDRFTLLRGEILAGNDSPELIKEFKSLLLKMSNSGQLPVAQVYRILGDLLALGK